MTPQLQHWPECMGGDACRCAESGSVVMEGTMTGIQAERFKMRMDRDRIAAILATFYRAPLSMSSVQPLLTLAEELNPGLKR